jgi:uncharacterized damage-inducible protein DinB
MTKQELEVLYDYHYWARDRMLAALETLTPEQLTRDMGSSFRSVRDTVAHVYSADWIWYTRWTGESPTTPLPMEMFPDVASIRSAWVDLEGKVRTLLVNLDADGLERRLDYKLLNGQPGSTVFWQMAQHVVNHASYHRGQVTTLLRQLGVPPAKSMDLIAFYRERQS